MAKQTLPSWWGHPKSSEIFASVSDKSHNGQLQVLSATQDRGIVPRTEMNINIRFDKKSLPTYKQVVPGNFVIHLRSFQGGLAYSEVEGIISPAYTILEPKIEICDDFYKYLFQSADYIKRLSSAVYGIRDGKQISYHTFGALRIPLPPLAEQRIIAEILTAADKLIAVKERLIAAKQKQKRWLMQNLLTGEMRLPGFSGKWKRVKLGEIGAFTRGNGFQKKDFLENGVGCIHYGQIYTCYDTVAYKTKSFVSNKKAEQSSVVNKGDIVIAITSENIEDVGKCVAWLGEDDVVAGGHTAIYKHKQNSKYIAYWLQTADFFNQKRKLINGWKVIEIAPVHFEKVNIPIPPLPEQRAIASVLTAADREIELLTKELEQHRLIKKYLMQQLLTGKIRVNNLISQGKRGRKDDN